MTFPEIRDFIKNYYEVPTNTGQRIFEKLGIEYTEFADMILQKSGLVLEWFCRQ
jgi:hypothetical protein